MSRTARQNPSREKELWLIAGLAFVVAAVLALVSKGVGGDEEVAHYRLARYAFSYPEHFLSIYGRPLVTLILSIPAQGGFLVARLASAVATGLTAYAVGRTALRIGLWPWVGLVCLLLQPMFLAHVGKTMTEPYAACLIGFALLGLIERRPYLMAAMLGLAATARTELSLLLPLGFVVLLVWKQYRAMLLLPAALFFWNLFGFFTSGDPLWLLHQVDPKPYPRREAFLYVKAFVWIVGLGTFVPVMVGSARTVAGLLGRGWTLRSSDAVPSLVETEEALRVRRALLGSLVIVLVLFSVYTYLAAWRPLTFGNFRYLAYGAAPLAILGTTGIRILTDRRRRSAWIAVGVSVIAGASLWGHPVILGSDLLDRITPVVGIAAGVWAVWYAVPRRSPVVATLLTAVIGVCGLARFHQDDLHLRPTPEQAALKRAAAMLDPDLEDSGVIYSAHPLLSYYYGGDPYDSRRWPELHPDLLRRADPGDIWFWESHYTVRPGSDFAIGNLLAHPQWEYLGGLASADSTWAGAFFRRRGKSDSPVPVMEDIESVETWARGVATVISGIGFARVGTAADPQDPGRWQILADRLAGQGRYTEAWAALEQADSLSPDDPAGNAVRAFIHLVQGDPGAALEAAEAARAKSPDNPHITFLNGQILWELGRKAEARPLIMESLESLADRWEVHLLAGDIHFEESRWPEAWREYQITIAQNPAHERAHLRAALCALRMGRPDEAETDLRALLTRVPGSVRGHLMLGDVLIDQGRTADAVRIWEGGYERTGDPALNRRLERYRNR